MPVITISRQFAAAGGPIGKALARRFDAEFLDREIVAQVAARAGLSEAEAEGYDERLPGVWQRIVTALALGGPDPSLPPLPAEMMPATAVHERLAQLTRAVIEEAAASGNAVIMGRGGAYIVPRGPGVLHVQLHAPLEARIRYLLTRVEEIRSTPARTRTRCASCAVPSMPGAPGTSSGCSARSGSTRKATISPWIPGRWAWRSRSTSSNSRRGVTTRMASGPCDPRIRCRDDRQVHDRCRGVERSGRPGMRCAAG